MNEIELKEGQEKGFVNLLNKNQNMIEDRRKAILPNAPMIDPMMELLDAPDCKKPFHLDDVIAPNTEQENVDDKIELEETNPLDTSYLPAE